MVVFECLNYSREAYQRILKPNKSTKTHSEIFDSVALIRDEVFDLEMLAFVPLSSFKIFRGNNEIVHYFFLKSYDRLTGNPALS